MTIDEAIENEKRRAESCKGHYDRFVQMEAKEHEQIVEWLEELKELREYKKRMEMQYLNDIDNPLEPLKLASALQSEIFKYEYRKEHKPQDINPLDYTVMYALKHCLEEQLKAGGEND